MKKCTRCEIIKNLKNFYICPSKSTGYSAECIDCTKIRSKLYRNNNKIKNSLRCKTYADKNKEKYSEYSRKRYQEKRDEIRAKNSAWSKANPDKNVAKSHRRRARLRGADGSYTVEEWKDLCNYYSNMCVCCYTVTKLTVDHIVPISRGGSNIIDNIQPLCLSCNDSKGTKIKNYKHWFMVA